MSSPLPPRLMHALCAEAEVSTETLHRRLAGLPLRPSTADRLERAARRLGVTLPPLGPAPGGWGASSPPAPPAPAV